jgi:hypothetical protein
MEFHYVFQWLLKDAQYRVGNPVVDVGRTPTNFGGVLVGKSWRLTRLLKELPRGNVAGKSGCLETLRSPYPSMAESHSLLLLQLDPSLFVDLGTPGPQGPLLSDRRRMTQKFKQPAKVGAASYFEPSSLWALK